jgi:uncharacterized protein with ParB-like and HNH nuclease domain
MSTSISVNKRCVSELLKSGTKNTFIIPEYQRSYAWGEEQCRTLWDDLVNFDAQNEEPTYFLGTIVFFENDNNEYEIIDGQQRITTLFLLLRAIYKQLESMKENDEVLNFRSLIGPCIWNVSPRTGKVDDFSKIHITSRVITDADNEIFSEILKSGDIKEKRKDNYSTNYLLFKKLVDELAKNDPMNWYLFCNKILQDCILLPIQCDKRETALTIFSTLNDRGLPLLDSDIFKAKIYSSLDDTEKNSFIEEWKELDNSTEEAGIKIQDLFYQYMFYLRAKKNDRDTTTPGLRKYFELDKSSQLYEKSLMTNLSLLANLWRVINNREEVDENWSKDIGIKKTLDCLKSYPNEFWKYPIVIYYLTHRKNSDFNDKFAIFLNRFFAFICVKYINTPTINAVKKEILNINSEIINTDSPRFHISVADKENLKNGIADPHKNTVRMILKALAYMKQDDLLPDKWEIEHILPQKWQTTSLFGHDKKDVEHLIEQIGNKIPFEKKLNIIAGNKYFLNKKKEYAKSKIAIAKDLSKTASDDWTPPDILTRTNEIKNTMIALFESYNVFENQKNSALITPEEQKVLDSIKARGISLEIKGS